jgi:hypothetical protein
VVQVQRLAVRVAAGRAPHLEEFLDLRVVDRQVAGAEPRRSEPWLIASVRLSITRMKGMTPRSCRCRPTFSPMPRRLPQ